MDDLGAVFVCELDGRDDFRPFKLFAVARAAWSFGVDGVLYVADETPSEFRSPDPGFWVERVRSFEEALELCPEHRPVFVEQGGVPLPDYEHPGSALYFFGGDMGAGLRPTEDADLVEVPSRTALYAHQAAAIVAWDRSARNVRA